MRWLPHLLIRPRKTGRPEPSGDCARVGCISPNWYRVDGGLVRQCDECGHVTSVVTQAPLIAGGIDATCSTDNRPSDDFEGCRE